MDSDKEPSADNLPNCSICKTAESDLHCNTCRINVCSVCVGEHISTALTIQHNVVSFELRDNDIKHQMCNRHINFWCNLHCEQCNVAVCSQCCTDLHQSHQVMDITKLYEKIIGNINLDNHNLEMIIKEYVNIIEKIKEQMSNLCRAYDEMRSQVSKQGQIWHDELDKIIMKYQSEIKNMEKESGNILQQHLSEMQSCLTIVQETMENNTEKLNSNDGNQLLCHKSQTEELRKIAPVLQLSLPVFKSHPIQTDNLFQQFGTMKPSVQSTKQCLVKIIPFDTEYDSTPPIGSRVRSGPDWRWDNQEDNLAGTVTAQKIREGTPDLRVLQESDLEELTLKAANSAADCTDPKSQGADTILCIDTSESMRGKPFEQIKTFVHSFLEGINDLAVEHSLEENLALVTFGKETRVIQYLTNDYEKIWEAFDTLEIGGPSPVMTGLVLCLSAIYKRGGVVTFRERKIHPRIILLSDGRITDQRILNGPDVIVKQGGTRKEIWQKLMEFAERFRTHHDPRHLVCVPVGDADMDLLGQLVDTAGGTVVSADQVNRISHHFLINTVVAKVIHDGVLRGQLPADDDLRKKIKETEGAGQFNDMEIVCHVTVIVFISAVST